MVSDRDDISTRIQIIRGDNRGRVVTRIESDRTALLARFDAVCVKAVAANGKDHTAVAAARASHVLQVVDTDLTAVRSLQIIGQFGAAFAVVDECIVNTRTEICNCFTEQYLTLTRHP